MGGRIEFWEAVEWICKPVDFLVRRDCRCLKWQVGAVVDCWAEGRVPWGGGVQASDLGRFGKDWRSVVKAIFRRGGVGLQLASAVEIRVNWGWF